MMSWHTDTRDLPRGRHEIGEERTAITMTVTVEMTDQQV